MTDLHPHWHSTQDDMIVIPASTETHAPQLGQSVSRRPAAIVGIILVCAAGFLLVGNVGDIVGQLGGAAESSSSSAMAGTGVVIHITDDGVDPAQATIMPGQEITWINDSDIPHILESEDILDEDGASLYTAAIFPGTSTTFRLSPDQPAGTFRYTSTTSDGVTGDLFVVTDGTADTGTETDPLGTEETVKDPFADPFAAPEGAGSPEFPTLPEDPFADMQSSSSEASDIGAPVLPDNIPTNPNSFQSLSDPLFGGETQPTHQAASYSPHPDTQPTTGLETWASLPFAVLVFLFVERRVLRRRHA